MTPFPSSAPAAQNLNKASLSNMIWIWWRRNLVHELAALRPHKDWNMAVSFINRKHFLLPWCSIRNGKDREIRIFKQRNEGQILSVSNLPFKCLRGKSDELVHIGTQSNRRQFWINSFSEVIQITQQRQHTCSSQYWLQCSQPYALYWMFFFHPSHEIRPSLQCACLLLLCIRISIPSCPQEGMMALRNVILNYQHFSKLILSCFSKGFVSSVWLHPGREDSDCSRWQSDHNRPWSPTGGRAFTLSSAKRSK